jgi:hypothetical protein
MGNGIEGKDGGERPIHILLLPAQQRPGGIPLTLEAGDVSRRHAQKNRFDHRAEKREEERQKNIQKKQDHGPVLSRLPLNLADLKQ